MTDDWTTEVYYFDEDGKPVDEKDAKFIKVVRVTDLGDIFSIHWLTPNDSHGPSQTETGSFPGEESAPPSGSPNQSTKGRSMTFPPKESGEGASLVFSNPLDDGDPLLKFLLAEDFGEFTKAFGPHQIFPTWVIEELKKIADLLWAKFVGISREASRKIGELIFRRVEFKESLDLKDMMAEIKRVDSGISDIQAEAIARTEMTNIVNKGREIMWKEEDPTGTKFKYALVGPFDHRTCEAHKEIHARQGNGLPLDQLKTLTREVFDKYFADSSLELRNDFQFHPHQRHVLVRRMM